MNARFTHASGHCIMNMVAEETKGKRQSGTELLKNVTVGIMDAIEDVNAEKRDPIEHILGECINITLGRFSQSNTAIQKLRMSSQAGQFIENMVTTVKVNNKSTEGIIIPKIGSLGEQG